jgi:ABC-type branched-subunit amino acid transport system substrate-binding protein
MGRQQGRRGRALLVLLTLTATACAGEVGRYRDASYATAGQAAPAPAADTAAVPTADPAAGGGTGTVAIDAPVPGSSSAAAAAPSGSPVVTTASGPVAQLSRPSSSRAAASSAASAPSGGGAATVASGPAPGQATAGGSGSPAAPSPGGGGGGGGGGAPAPVPATGGTTTGVTKDTITIGVFYPKTGFYSGVARNAPAVAQAAFDEAGLINGRRVVLKYYDDGTANASTIQVEEKRAKDEVFSLVSVVGESNVVLAPLANQHKVPLIVGNIDRKVALPLTYVFPVYPYWAHQATILPGFIKNVLSGGAKKIGVVYEGTSTAIDAKNAFKSKARELGLNVIFEQPIAQNQSTCANEVSNLQSRGVELVFMLNGPLGGICMLRDARALGYRPTWTGIGPSWGFNVVAQASGGGADGVRMIRVTPTLESAEGRHYTEIMRKAAPNSGAENDDLLLIFYALLKSAIEGLRRAGPDLTREGLVQTWETTMNGYESGYLPPPTFGPGNRSGPLVVGVGTCCTDGKWTTPQQGWRATF